MFANFKPSINGKPLNNITYRLASANDATEIAKITFEREGLRSNKDFKYYFERTQKELENIGSVTAEFNCS